MIMALTVGAPPKESPGKKEKPPKVARALLPFVMGSAFVSFVSFVAPVMIMAALDRAEGSHARKEKPPPRLGLAARETTTPKTSAAVKDSLSVL